LWESRIPCRDGACPASSRSNLRIHAILKHCCEIEMIRPTTKSFSAFLAMRRSSRREVDLRRSADPVSAFLAVAEGEPDAFLLESVEGGEKIGRYNISRVRPFLRLESRGAEITSNAPTARKSSTSPATSSTSSKTFYSSTARAHSNKLEGLPPSRGRVGYFAYDIVRRLEDIGEHATDDLHVPTAS